MILDETGISVELHTPLWTNDVTIYDDLHGYLTQFSKDEGVWGGYLSASFTAEIHRSALDLWMNYLGHDLQVYNELQELIWQGFINEITINFGALSLKLGPFVNIANRVDVQYQTTSYTTNPPIGGNQTSTGLADNTDSQAKYGVLETNISGGQGLIADMIQLRDTFLTENSVPAVDKQINLGNQQDLAVSVSLLGYHALLGRFYYQATGTGTQTIDDKIKAILAAHPTLTFNMDAIDANALAIPVASDGTKTGLDEIQNIVARGNSSNQRYVFGVYGNVADGLIVVYTPIETTIDQLFYNHSASENGEQVTLISGAVVSPWNVRSGKWLAMLDIEVYPSRPDDNLKEDIRNVFIESVSYTAPSTITITGGTLTKTKQILAKLGLGGM